MTTETKFETVTTTAGEAFTAEESVELAQLVYKRFGRDVGAATAAWNRMHQSSVTEADFGAEVGS